MVLYGYTKKTALQFENQGAVEWPQLVHWATVSVSTLKYIISSLITK